MARSVFACQLHPLLGRCHRCAPSARRASRNETPFLYRMSEIRHPAGVLTRWYSRARSSPVYGWRNRTRSALVRNDRIIRSFAAGSCESQIGSQSRRQTSPDRLAHSRSAIRSATRSASKYRASSDSGWLSNGIESVAVDCGSASQEYF